MSETRSGIDGFNGTGLEFLGEELVAFQSETNSVQSELEILERQRQDALDLAEKPFIEPIRAAKAKVSELAKQRGSQAIAEKIRTADLDEMSFTALDVLLKQRRTSLYEFASGMRALIQSNNPEYDLEAQRAESLLASFAGFMAFKRDLERAALENRFLPVGVFAVEWVEETDAQADWEGRDPSTGIFYKRVDASVGMAELCIHSELEIDKTAALLDYSYHLGRLAKKFTVEDRFAVIDASITLDPYVEDPITRRVLSDSGIQREEYGKIVISYGLTDPAFIAQALAAQVQRQRDPSSSEVQL